MSTTVTDVGAHSSRVHLVRQLRNTRFKQSWVDIPAPKGTHLRKLEEEENKRALIFHQIQKRKKAEEENNNHKCQCTVQ